MLLSWIIWLMYVVNLSILGNYVLLGVVDFVGWGGLGVFVFGCVFPVDVGFEEVVDVVVEDCGGVVDFVVGV